MAKIIVSGPSPKEIQEKVINDISKIEKGIFDISKQIEARLKQEIKSNIRREGAGGDLINSIDTTLIPSVTNPSAGVGDIFKMFKEAPYWFVVNYGKVSASQNPQDLIEGNTGRDYVPPVTRGSFGGSPSQPQPGTSQNQRWKVRTNGKYYLVPKKSIRPMNYIEKTTSWLVTYWDDFWANRVK